MDKSMVSPFFDSRCTDFYLLIILYVLQFMPLTCSIHLSDKSHQYIIKLFSDPHLHVNQNFSCSIQNYSRLFTTWYHELI